MVCDDVFFLSFLGCGVVSLGAGVANVRLDGGSAVYLSLSCLLGHGFRGICAAASKGNEISDGVGLGGVDMMACMLFRSGGVFFTLVCLMSQKRGSKE